MTRLSQSQSVIELDRKVDLFNLTIDIPLHTVNTTLLLVGIQLIDLKLFTIRSYIILMMVRSPKKPVVAIL